MRALHNASIVIASPAYSGTKQSHNLLIIQKIDQKEGFFKDLDMAFAAASNSHGLMAVALNVSISFLKATKAGDKLVAEAKEKHAGGRVALYDITVRDEQTGCLFQP